MQRPFRNIFWLLSQEEMRDYEQQSENCNQWKRDGTLDIRATGANKPRITDKDYASSIKGILIQIGSHLTVQRIFQNIN